VFCAVPASCIHYLEAASHSSQVKSRKPWNPPRVKTLTKEDLEKYSIFDVIMPLSGTDVAYPGGELGEKYREFLCMDGLDPDDFVRKQRSARVHGLSTILR
jgi:tRNA pseudouridine13 synthase